VLDLPHAPCLACRIHRPLSVARPCQTYTVARTHVRRADIKQYIGLPSPRAIYQILRSCLLELMRVQIIVPAAELAPATALTSQITDTAALTADASASLFFCACKAHGLSGRALRKLPFLAHAKFLRSNGCNPSPCSVLGSLSHSITSRTQALPQ